MTPTGRAKISDPEMQNLPETPAALLERAYAMGGPYNSSVDYSDLKSAKPIAKDRIGLAQIASDNVQSSLTTMVDTATAVIEQAQTLPLIKVLEAFKVLRDEHDAIDEARKKLNAKIETLSREVIPELLRDMGTSNFKADDLGYRFQLARRFSASMLDKVKGFDWLRKNGHGAVIIETVNANTLASLAKELGEKNVQLPEDTFKTSTLIYTSIAKI